MYYIPATIKKIKTYKTYIIPNGLFYKNKAEGERQILLFTFFSRAPLHVLRARHCSAYVVVSAIPLTCITQCYWRVFACMNAPDLATIWKCDQLIRFKIDGSTIRTHLTFAIKSRDYDQIWIPFEISVRWLLYLGTYSVNMIQSGCA